MSNERKPKEISMNEFFTKILQMSNILTMLDPSILKYTISELGKIIAKVLPECLAVNYMKQGGKKLTIEGEIKTLLNILEEVDTIDNKMRNARERYNIGYKHNKGSNGNNQYKQGKRNSYQIQKKNMCSFPGHEKYEFKECKYNLKSKNYCRKHFKNT